MKRHRDVYDRGRLDDAHSDDEQLRKPFRSRIVEPRPLYEASTWGRMLTDPRTQDPGNKRGKLFRRRLRVPFPIFEIIV